MEPECLHHPKEIFASIKQRQDWEDKINHNRCRNCWLRRYDCYCDELKSRNRCETAPAADADIQVLIYYHYSEIGRSPNTAHVFNLVAPELSRDSLIFGDVERETLFINSLEEEKARDEPITCVLYPSNNAVYINEWLEKRKNKTLPIRLVLLDGTYSHSDKQMKFIENKFNGLLPVVKLDLGECGIRSAIAGIMHQPAIDKICSYQALVIALRQVGMSANYCDYLSNELDEWLIYILKKKIRFGKRNFKLRGAIEGESKYAEYVRDHLVRNPPPIGDKVGRKQRKYKSMEALDRVREYMCSEAVVEPNVVLELTEAFSVYSVK